MQKLNELAFKILLFYFYALGKRMIGKGDKEAEFSCKMKLKALSPTYSLEHGITAPFVGSFYERYNKLPKITEITFDEAMLYAFEFFYQGAGLAKTEGVLYFSGDNSQKNTKEMADHYNEIDPMCILEYDRVLGELKKWISMNTAE